MERNKDYKISSYFISKDFDYHIHIGQFYDKYYEPHKVIEDLVEKGIKGCWFSSTTSCIKWDNECDKKYLLKHIQDEVKEALYIAKKFDFDAKALYWISLFEYKELFDDVNFKDVDNKYNVNKYMIERLSSCDYFGFKIHTRNDIWDIKDEKISLIFETMCDIANRYNMPILIHSGVDEEENPKKFEKWYNKYNNVKFVIAHLKPENVIIDLLKEYKNLYADTAFANENVINEVKENGMGERIIYGTDYPIISRERFKWNLKKNK